MLTRRGGVDAVPRRMTREEFIVKARAVHGDKYDYSKVEYVNNNTNVVIICPEHGEFQQTPHNHLKGKGCWACAGVKPLTQEQFIEKAKAVHGEKYDYSETIYERNNRKVKIVCPLHGEFWQVPMTHLKGVGCPACGNVARHATHEEYLCRAETRRQTCLSKHGVDNVMKIPGMAARNFQVKIENGTTNTSSEEDVAYGLLVQHFGEDDVVREYKSEKYPFHCDFYVRSLDLYIELNLFWTHGGHFYDANSDSDGDKLKLWKSRVEKNPFYKKAIHTWTVRDVKKRNCAVQNGLNYLVFWDVNLGDFMAWFANLSCERGDAMP